MDAEEPARTPGRIGDARIVVIGGGLCGAAFALHLLRDHPRLAAEVAVIEPRARLGAGLAYSTDEATYRINVASNRMLVMPEDETSFDRWLRARDEAARDPAALLDDGRLYPARAAFGVYFDELVRAAAAAVTDGPRLVHVRARAVAAAPRAGGGYVVTLDDGACREADIVVLAVGHPPPALPSPLAPVAGHPAILADPWDGARLRAVASDASVLVVGTGLTGCDVIAGLLARGHRGPIRAVSRRGLLPRPRTTRPVTAYGDFAAAPARTALSLLRRVRRTIDAGAAGGQPWEGAVDQLRIQGPEIWAALPHAERLRLLRHLRAFWDVHRFQCAPQVADAVAAGQASGQVRIGAARLGGVRPAGARLFVTLHPRGGPAPEEVAPDAVVNCTGPDQGRAIDAIPVLASLAAQGRLRPDPCGLGIAVDPHGRVLGPDDAPATDLFVAGPLARGTYGELMGLPRVSLQPREVAADVAGLLAARLPA